MLLQIALQAALLAGATLAQAEQEPLASMPLPGAEGSVPEAVPPSDDWRFDMFPLHGAHCSVASSDEKSTWPTALLRDGGLEYIQKHKRDEVDIDKTMIEAYDPRGTATVESFNEAFAKRCTRLENVEGYYMFHDNNIGHLGYGVDEKNKVLYMCFMFGQDREGVVGSGGECTYF